MALLKPIQQPDGVVTNYHRILYFKSTINMQSSIVVLSYLHEVARESEREASFSPYVKSKTYEMPWSPDLDVASAYAYLKTLPDFKGANDI